MNDFGRIIKIKIRRTDQKIITNFTIVERSILGFIQKQWLESI